LVPASSFSELKEVKPAILHCFAINSEDPRPLFAFATIWRRWVGPIKKDGPAVAIETYSFMTTTPNPLVASINHQRMPVLLTGEDAFETWMRGTPNEAFALAREYPTETMTMVQSGLEKRELLSST
jgi:putative SOS response-associated peptidase YedK